MSPTRFEGRLMDHSGAAASRPGRHVSTFVNNLPKSAGIVALSVGTLVLLGWTADVEILTRPFPGAVATNPLSAAALALTGAALLLLKRRAALARACAWAAAAVGAVRLVYPIDTLLLASK